MHEVYEWDVWVCELPIITKRLDIEFLELGDLASCESMSTKHVCPDPAPSNYETPVRKSTVDYL